MSAPSQLRELVDLLPEEIAADVSGVVAVVDSISPTGHRRADLWADLWIRSEELWREPGGRCVVMASSAAEVRAAAQLVSAGSETAFMRALLRLLQVTSASSPLPQEQPSAWTRYLPLLESEGTSSPTLHLGVLQPDHTSRWWRSTQHALPVHFAVVAPPDPDDMAKTLRAIKSWTRLSELAQGASAEDLLHVVRALAADQPDTHADQPEASEPTPSRRRRPRPPSLGLGRGPADLSKRSEELLEDGFGE